VCFSYLLDLKISELTGGHSERSLGWSWLVLPGLGAVLADLGTVLAGSGRSWAVWDGSWRNQTNNQTSKRSIEQTIKQTVNQTSKLLTSSDPHPLKTKNVKNH